MTKIKSLLLILLLTGCRFKEVLLDPTVVVVFAICTMFISITIIWYVISQVEEIREWIKLLITKKK